jgi:plasmid stabilization system protein ParE
MKRAKEALWAAIDSLDHLPDRGAPTALDGVRELFVSFGREGYVVIYLVEARRVTILRIFHTREDR